MTYQPPSKVGQRHPLLPQAKAHLTRFSYGAPLKGDTTDVITADYLVAQRQFKNNVHFDVVRGKRQGPDVDPNSTAFDWAVQRQMGLDTAPPAAGKPFIAYNFTGTWGAWDNGFGWDVCLRLDKNRFDIQGLGYNTNAFMIGNDPAHSYIDMLNDGTAEYLRLALPNRQRKVLCGYSGGAGTLVQSLYQWPADRRAEIAAVVQFGDPNRPPGKTLLGNDPGGHGISEDFPPDWILNRYYSFTLPGDMYPNATGLLPIFYDILVRMEATPEFAHYLFTLFIAQAGNLSALGAAALGKAGNPAALGFGALASLLPLLTGGQGELPNLVAMLFNIGAIIESLKKLLNFVISGDHGMYGDPKHAVFGGLTAVDRAAQIVNALT